MNARLLLLRSVPQRAIAPLMLVAAMTVAGCGDAVTIETFPVRGQVLVNGKPAEHASVVLFPLSTDDALRTLAPRARTDSAGFYELKTFWGGDGAPRGDFKVTVVWKGPLPANANSEDFNMDVYEDRPDILKGKYANPETTPLRMTIDGSGDLPLLELTTR